MNLMPEIARILGVEMGEELYCTETGANVKAKLTENGLEVYDGSTSDYHPNYPWTVWLLTGRAKVKKKSSEPQQGEVYYTVGTNGDICMYLYDAACSSDVIRYRIGNCYPTHEAAEADREKWLSFYHGKGRVVWEEKS